MKTISTRELKEKMDRGDDFLLLEVLGEAAYERAHLPGAVRFQNMEQVEDLAPDKSAEIIAYCSNFN